MTLFLGNDAARVEDRPVYLDDIARTRHMYVVGQTGTGKSVFLTNIAIQAFATGGGAYIDPHGDNATELLAHISTRRAADVLIIDLADREHPIGLNFLHNVSVEDRSFVAAKGVSLLVHIFGEDAVGDRSQQLFRNAQLAVMETPGSSLLTVLLMLRDNKLRAKLLSKVKDPIVRSYWKDEFENYDDKFRDQVVSPILNKLDALLSHQSLRNILSQPSGRIDFRKLIDQQKLLIVMLRKGTIGEHGARMIGELLFSELTRAAFTRDDSTHRPLFECIVDEFQNVVNDDTDTVLSEARKYGLSLTLAHQYLEQIPRKTLAAIFGNVGTFVTFRVSPSDADILSEQLVSVDAKGILDLPNFRAWLRPLRNGAPDTPVVLQAPPPPLPPRYNASESLRAKSRRGYAKPRKQVEEHIQGLFNL